MKRQFLLQLTVPNLLVLQAAAQNQTNSNQSNAISGLSVFGYYCLTIYGISILLGCYVMIYENKEGLKDRIKGRISKCVSSLSACFRRQQPRMHADDLLEQLVPTEYAGDVRIQMDTLEGEVREDFTDYRLQPVLTNPPREVLNAYVPPQPTIPYVEDEADRLMDAADHGIWPLTRSHVLGDLSKKSLGHH